MQSLELLFLTHKRGPRSAVSCPAHASPSEWCHSLDLDGSNRIQGHTGMPRTTERPHTSQCQSSMARCHEQNHFETCRRNQLFLGFWKQRSGECVKQINHRSCFPSQRTEHCVAALLHHALHTRAWTWTESRTVEECHTQAPAIQANQDLTGASQATGRRQSPIIEVCHTQAAPSQANHVLTRASQASGRGQSPTAHKLRPRALRLVGFWDSESNEGACLWN